MKKYLFWTILIAILISSFILHVHAIANNNFHFTVDQGNDAIHIRDLIHHPRIIFRGPETSIRGVYAGPLWYYFIAAGYMFAQGNPVGAVYPVILLNLATTAVLILFLRKRAGEKTTLFIGVAHLSSWYFFETALWSFNPFPLIFLATVLCISLTLFLEQNTKRYYILALFATLLSFNTDLAGAAVFLLFISGISVYALLRKKISIKFFFVVAILPLGLAVLAVLYDFYNVYEMQLLRNVKGSGLHVFSGTDATYIINVFSEMLAKVVFPQNFYIGIFLLSLILFLYFARFGKNKKTQTFIHLVLMLFCVSLVFFSTNKGYRDWHSSFLPPIFFSAILLMILDFPKKSRILFFTLIIGANFFYFVQRYKGHLEYSSDSSMLYNQLSVLDWMYIHNDDDGFNVYNYTNTFYDYPYQYLFFWYGKNKYGFLPCEYANFPKAPKHMYIPNYLEYTEPQLGCNRIRFLIIQDDTNGQSNADWIDDFRNETSLVEKTEIGRIKVEKREVIQ